MSFVPNEDSVVWRKWPNDMVVKIVGGFSNWEENALYKVSRRSGSRRRKRRRKEDTSGKVEDEESTTLSS